MDAELLPKAVTILRDTAEGLNDPIKWEVEESDGPLLDVYPAESDSALLSTDPDTAHYIAMMHPGVGLALADLLERIEDERGGEFLSTLHPAIVIARLIAGEESSPSD